MKNQIRIALIGHPGAGKDTLSKIIKEKAKGSCILVKLADPLYEVQDYIYKTCGVNKDFYDQDGVLLNFLGQYMRKINKDVLKDRLKNMMQTVKSTTDYLVCSDARPLDISFLKKMNFSIVLVSVSPSISIERRKSRGDLTFGDQNHSTESGLEDVTPDYVIDNNDGLPSLYEQAANLLARLT